MNLCGARAQVCLSPPSNLQHTHLLLLHIYLHRAACVTHYGMAPVQTYLLDSREAEASSCSSVRMNTGCLFSLHTPSVWLCNLIALMMKLALWRYSDCNQIGLLIRQFEQLEGCSKTARSRCVTRFSVYVFVTGSDWWIMCTRQKSKEGGARLIHITQISYVLCHSLQFKLMKHRETIVLPSWHGNKITTHEPLPLLL